MQTLLAFKTHLFLQPHLFPFSALIKKCSAVEACDVSTATISKVHTLLFMIY